MGSHNFIQITVTFTKLCEGGDEFFFTLLIFESFDISTRVNVF